MTLFQRSDFPKTLPRRRESCPELKCAKKFGVRAPLFEGRAVDKIFSTLNISKTGGAIFAKFSAIAGIDGPYLRFGPEVGGGSNFGGSEEQSCQKWHVGSRVVALCGSQLNCTTDISNIFGGYVSRDIRQHHAYIYETQ